MIRLTSASGGESQSITPSDSTIRRTLPLIIGMNIRSPWTSVVSELARATSWPVGIRSRRGEVHPLEVGLHLVAQVVLDLQRDPAAAVAAQVGGEEGARGDHDQGDQPGQQRFAPFDDHAVDDLALEQRRARLAGGTEDGGGEGDGDVAPVAEDVAEEAAQPALRRLWRARVPPEPRGASRSSATSSRASPSSPSDSSTRVPSAVRSVSSSSRPSISASTAASAASPAGVRASVAARRSSAASARESSPRLQSDSTAALTVGLPSASRIATREARSSPSATAERTR